MASIGIYTAPSPDKKVYVTEGDSLNTTVSLSPGTYNTVVQAVGLLRRRILYAGHRQSEGVELHHNDQRASPQGLARLGRTGAQL